MNATNLQCATIDKPEQLANDISRYFTEFDVEWPRSVPSNVLFENWAGSGQDVGMSRQRLPVLRVNYCVTEGATLAELVEGSTDARTP